MSENNINLANEQSRCIAHEIRNHLSICELYAEIIKKHLEKENIQNSSIDNAINCIKKSVKIMGNSLLDLKSLNNLKQDTYDLKTLIENAVDMSTVYIQDKNIKISCDIRNNAYVYVDENKFLACIVNIIKNAVEAIDNIGVINVSVFTKNNLAYIDISNNGKPISKNKQNEIFVEGFTTKSTGSGLGLHICVNNLKIQNAELKLLKSDSKTTAFEIALPIIEN